MRVWILQTGEPVWTDDIDSRPMRAMNLSDALISAGHEVTLWTSRFNHFTNSQRETEPFRIHKIKEHLFVRFIPSPGYKRNISIMRLIDHAILARNLKRAMLEAGEPDIAFIGYPPIETAWVFSRWLNKRQIKFVLDVKDAWPDMIVERLPRYLRMFARILLHPYYKMRDMVFRSAFAFSSISEGFLQWCVNTAGRSLSEFDTVLPLVNHRPSLPFKELELEKQWLESIGRQTRFSPRLYFLGTIGTAYDFNSVINLAARRDVEIVIAGDGSQEKYWRQRCGHLPNIVWTGWISTRKAHALANESEIAIMPYKESLDFSFDLTIPNKMYDAMSYGKAVVVSGGKHMKEFVEKNGIGYVFNSENPDSLIEVVDCLLSNPSKLKRMKSNSLRLYRKQFDSKRTYGSFVVKLESFLYKS